MVAAGQVEQRGERDAPLEQEQAGLGRGHVLLGVALLAAEPTGDQQPLGLDRLEQGQGDAGLGGQLGDGERLLAGAPGSERRPPRPSVLRRLGSLRPDRPGSPLAPVSSAEEGLVGGVELAGDQPDDGGQGEAPLLEGADPVEPLEVRSPYQATRPCAARRVEQPLLW